MLPIEVEAFRERITHSQIVREIDGKRVLFMSAALYVDGRNFSAHAEVPVHGDPVEDRSLIQGDTADFERGADGEDPSDELTAHLRRQLEDDALLKVFSARHSPEVKLEARRERRRQRLRVSAALQQRARAETSWLSQTRNDRSGGPVE